VRLGTSIKANLHQIVVSLEISRVQLVGVDIVVDQLLPRNRNTEDIETVDVGKVLHLSLRHVGGWAAILAFELVRSEVALGFC